MFCLYICIKCRLFDRIQTARGGLLNGVTSWSKTMPMLNYKGMEPQSVVKSTEITQIMSFNEVSCKQIIRSNNFVEVVLFVFIIFISISNHLFINI